MVSRLDAYLVDVERVVAHEIAMGEGPRIPLLQWVAALLAWGEDEEDRAQLEREAAAYLLSGAAGMEHAAEFRRAWLLADDLPVLSDRLPEPLDEQFQDILNAEDGRFPPEADPRLAVLGFPGWSFFSREEMRMVRDACRGPGEADRKHLRFADVWRALFDNALERPHDLVLFRAVS